MKIAIMQPTFNPWIGHFDVIDFVDKFIFFDTVQFMKRDWQTRNKFIVQGREHFFTIPVKKSPRFRTKIFEAKISNDNFDFRKKLIQLIETNYKKAKYFNEVHSFIKEIINFQTDYLSEFNINMIKNISEKIGIDTEFVVLSKTDFKSDKTKGELILDICKYFIADEYISPKGAKDYMMVVVDLFKRENIKIFFQNYQHPVYNRLANKFISYIGIFDLLYNEGFKNSKNIIISGRKYNYFGE